MPDRRLNNGLDTIRDFLKDEGAQISVGTDDSDPVKTQTSLGNEVAETDATGGTNGTGISLTTARFSTGEANGNDLVEAAIEDSNDNALTRSTFASVSKTSDFELELRVEQTVTNA